MSSTLVCFLCYDGLACAILNSFCVSLTTSHFLPPPNAAVHTAVSLPHLTHRDLVPHCSPRGTPVHGSWMSTGNMHRLEAIHLCQCFASVFHHYTTCIPYSCVCSSPFPSIRHLPLVLLSLSPPSNSKGCCGCDVCCGFS